LLQLDHIIDNEDYNKMHEEDPETTKNDKYKLKINKNSFL